MRARIDWHWLTEDEKAAIFADLEHAETLPRLERGKYTRDAIAKRHNIHKRTIQKLIKRENWRPEKKPSVEYKPIGLRALGVSL